MPTAFALEVPADPTNLATLRVFVRSVARSAGIHDAPADDLELLASELAAAFVDASTIRLSVSMDDHELVVSIDASGGDTSAPPDAQRRALVEALAPGVSWESTGARAALSLVAEALEP